MTAGPASATVTEAPASILSHEVQLPCGAVLPNRLAKAAMTEGLADERNDVTEELLTLYRRWATNGLGLMLTGNVQVDRTHLERPGNIVVDERTDLAAHSRLAAVGTVGGRHFWVQINHTGRQTPEGVNPQSPRSPRHQSGHPKRRATPGCVVRRPLDQMIEPAWNGRGK